MPQYTINNSAEIQIPAEVVRRIERRALVFHLNAWAGVLRADGDTSTASAMQAEADRLQALNDAETQPPPAEAGAPVDDSVEHIKDSIARKRDELHKLMADLEEIQQSCDSAITYLDNAANELSALVGMGRG